MASRRQLKLSFDKIFEILILARAPRRERVYAILFKSALGVMLTVEWITVWLGMNVSLKLPAHFPTIILRMPL